MRKILKAIAVWSLIVGVLTGCSNERLYSDGELGELHDVIRYVEEGRIAYVNVIEDSLTSKLEEKLQTDTEFADYLSTRNYDPSKPVIALTFDDGPREKSTNELLDILEENKAKATFFVLGSSLDGLGDQAEPILKRMVSAGCEIGNHSADHKQLTSLDASGIHNELDPVNEKIQSLSGKACRLMRPPYGSADANVSAAVSQPMIFWDIDSLDWKTRNAQSTISIIEEHVCDGAIILMHDIHPETIEACRTLIPDLIAKGYQLVTISEMAYLKGITLEPGEKYYEMMPE